MPRDYYNFEKARVLGYFREYGIKNVLICKVAMRSKMAVNSAIFYGSIKITE